MSEFQTKYEYCERFETRQHTWFVVGSHMALHLHISEYTGKLRENMKPLGEYGEFQGGLEYHWRFPPKHARRSAPDHQRCQVLEAPCWHDGTSLWVTEHWIPFWRSSPHDHDRMLRALEVTLRERIDEELATEDVEVGDVIEGTR